MYKLLLIRKYLRKRRIAWVSLAAVMLCTTMVLVVISVMGGFLDMFSAVARRSTGDLVVRTQSLSGFPFYEAMVERIDAMSDVSAAAPEILAPALLNINDRRTSMVQVHGIPIELIGKINDFPQSLYLQYHKPLAAGEKPPAPSFDYSSTRVELGHLPAGVFVDPDTGQMGTGADPHSHAVTHDANPVWDKIRYRVDASTGVDYLYFTGHMSMKEFGALKALAHGMDADAAAPFLAAVHRLQLQSTYPGMICGSGLLDIRSDGHGGFTNRSKDLYFLWAKLVVASGINSQEGSSSLTQNSTTYRIVDDSHTGMYVADNNYVYVPLEQLQRSMGMDQQMAEADGKQVVGSPARVTEIAIRLKPGADQLAAQKRVAAVVSQVLAEKDPFGEFGVPEVLTWQEYNGPLLGAFQTQKVLLVILFAIISVVAVFLIFCIFYMIVAEKTRDVGIIKSVGASSAGVAGIFLCYGLCIGIVGSGLGLAAAYGIVHNINYLHQQMGQLMGIQIWDPRVYVFDSIPNTMNLQETLIIVGVAILSSVLGALAPAIVAANMNPVEALRWEQHPQAV